MTCMSNQEQGRRRAQDGGGGGEGGGGGPDPATACPDEFNNCMADAAEGGCQSLVTNAPEGQGPDMAACTANAACMPLFQCMRTQGGGDDQTRCPDEENACFSAPACLAILQAAEGGSPDQATCMANAECAAVMACMSQGGGNQGGGGGNQGGGNQGGNAGDDQESFATMCRPNADVCEPDPTNPMVMMLSLLQERRRLQSPPPTTPPSP